MDPWNYDETDVIMGRGTRQRKEVDYTDSLTEKEWMKVVFFFNVKKIKYVRVVLTGN